MLGFISRTGAQPSLIVPDNTSPPKLRTEAAAQSVNVDGPGLKIRIPVLKSYFYCIHGFPNLLVLEAPKTNIDRQCDTRTFSDIVYSTNLRIALYRW